MKEWTAQRMQQFLGIPSKYTVSLTFLADAVNAEQHRLKELLADAEFDAAFPKNELEKIRVLSEQLAAAYDRWQLAEQAFEKQREQLAAEQENSKLLCENLNRTSDKLAEALQSRNRWIKWCHNARRQVSDEQKKANSERARREKLSLGIGGIMRENQTMREALSEIAISNEDSQYMSRVAAEVLNHQPRKQTNEPKQ